MRSNRPTRFRANNHRGPWPSLDESELVEQFHRIAELQRNLLPHAIPQPVGWRIATHYSIGPWPSGDYYDFMKLPDGRIILAIADASGHGGLSAVMVATMRVVLRSCPLTSGRQRQPFCPLQGSVVQTPHIVLSHLNRILIENSLEGQFMTAFYGVLNPLVLAAARLCGIDEIYRVGGAQAIAALAYGTKSIPRVDKIVGPGNAYVAAAKRRVFGVVGIDMIAGPSEILVICDGQTDPDWIAMDLFSQAEHDELAQAILLTPEAALVENVAASMHRQLEHMPRRDIIAAALATRGALVRVREADLQRHLENGRTPEQKKEPQVTRTKPAPSPADMKPTELGSKDDFQLQQAIAFLKGEPVKTQSPSVAQTKTN